MFNNLINIHDLGALWHKVRRQRSLRTLRALFRGSSGRVQQSWEHTDALRSSWWDIPAVQARWNMLITGFPSTSYQEYVTTAFLPAAPARGLSIGCGGGNKEVKWVRACPSLHLTGIDISPQRITVARRTASAEGLSERLAFMTQDIYTLGVEPHTYDLIIADGALHHLHSLDTFLPNLRRWLTPEGHFVVNEYVGPSRFQWTDAQLRLTNELLATIPERLRTDAFGTVKRSIHRPGRFAMILSDPSEAVESAIIDPLLHEHFRVIDRKPYGGTILQNLLKDIAHHFTGTDPEAAAILQRLFDAEDVLLRDGTISSDFVCYVCHP